MSTPRQLAERRQLLRRLGLIAPGMAGAGGVPGRAAGDHAAGVLPATRRVRRGEVGAVLRWRLTSTSSTSATSTTAWCSTPTTWASSSAPSGLAVATTLGCLLIGFPTALYLALQSEKQAQPAAVPGHRAVLDQPAGAGLRLDVCCCAMAAWWTVRAGRVRPVPEGSARPALQRYTAVMIGLLYSFLPFMVLPIYTSLEKLDWRLVEAAFDLGANRWQALKRVILPLALPGMLAGATLVFIPALGNYIIPELLGGGKALMIGNLIQLQFGSGAQLAAGRGAGLLRCSAWCCWRCCSMACASVAARRCADEPAGPAVALHRPAPGGLGVLRLPLYPDHRAGGAELQQPGSRRPCGRASASSGIQRGGQ